MAGVYRMIDRAVTDTLVVHHLYYFGNGTYIFLCFSVQFHICDVSATGNSVERSFAFDFFNNTDRLFHVYVE